ncbi:cupin domain-containing protein [Amycolatopsis sp. ATCC 39116]|uniref:cupin domain-containing protein n=1 Tax=Amycolatopsis sp. (strain ATCC 39116 / 75iv2) TaxID=385957 RepID=UPI0002627984|nr:cupin domain-containing protein [Amycolatopsis sp. ATCC 39116]
MNGKIHLCGPGEGLPLAMSDGIHTVKAGAEHTGSVYEVFEVDAPRAPAAPPHRSPWAGTMYVLDGAVTVQADGETHDLGPGAAITIPAQCAFTFEVTTENARLLAVTTGDGAGRFFADFAATVPADRPLEEVLPRLLEVTRRHGVSIAEPGS